MQSNIRRPFAFFRYRVLTAALTAVAFAMLVLLTATHLHVSSTDEDGCEICSAVVGQLATPGTIDPLPPPRLYVGIAAPAATYRSAAPRRGANLLPPSCGPPPAA
jgi:hypothetical protein